MDVVAFIKSLVLDSLGGIPTKLIPFLIVQLILSVIISLFFGKIFKVESKELLQLVFSGVVILALSVIASISVPISIVFATLIILWVLKFKQLTHIDRVIFVMLQFLFGAGYVLLGVITIVIIGVYYLIDKRKS